MWKKLKGFKRWIAGLIVVLYFSLKPAITGQMLNKAGELGHGDLQGIAILFACYGIAVFSVITLVSMFVRAFGPGSAAFDAPAEE